MKKNLPKIAKQIRCKHQSLQTLGKAITKTFTNNQLYKKSKKQSFQQISQSKRRLDRKDKSESAENAVLKRPQNTVNNKCNNRIKCQKRWHHKVPQTMFLSMWGRSRMRSPLSNLLNCWCLVSIPSPTLWTIRLWCASLATLSSSIQQIENKYFENLIHIHTYSLTSNN